MYNNSIPNFVFECETYSKERYNKRRNNKDVYNLNIFPLIDKNYTEFIKQNNNNIHYDVDTISRLDFTNTLYEFISNNIQNSNTEDLIHIIDYYIFEKKITVFPFLFKGILDRSYKGFGRGGNEFHNYLSEGYHTLGYSKTDICYFFNHIYQIVTYIMDNTNYYLYDQPDILFSFLVNNDQYDFNYIDHILQSKNYLSLCFKFISSFNKDYCNIIHTEYDIDSYDGIYDSVNTTERMIFLRKKCREKFNKNYNHNISSTDINNLIFDYLVPKIKYKFIYEGMTLKTPDIELPK